MGNGSYLIKRTDRGYRSTTNLINMMKMRIRNSLLRNIIAVAVKSE